MAAERGSETGSQVLTPAQALALDRLPARVAVVGASGRAAELAELFCGAGSEVRWLIPAGAELLAPFDDVVLRMVTSALSEQGIEVVTDVADPAAAVDGEPCIVWFGTPRGCTGDLQLDRVQLQADASGFLAVDEQQRTANPRILAVGDVTGGAASAALATQQGQVAAEVCAGRPAASEPQAIPAVLWTTPQAAMVGLTQAAAAAAGYRTIQGRMPLSASGAGRLAAAAAGVTLVVAEADSEVVLGVTLVGPGAAERIGQAALALEMGATLTDLSATLQPHPTLSETLPEAAADALGAAIHLFHLSG
jgi:dihydrolipoamide dehydrogenase